MDDRFTLGKLFRSPLPPPQKKLLCICTILIAIDFGILNMLMKYTGRLLSTLFMSVSLPALDSVRAFHDANLFWIFLSRVSKQLPCSYYTQVEVLGILSDILSGGIQKMLRLPLPIHDLHLARR